jgi:hypothetical protein
VRYDPKFERTRENGREFGRAGKASKLLRDALRSAMLNVADGRVVSRLTTACLRMVQSDPVNGRGERTASNGDASLLVGFEFNVKTPVTQTIAFPFATAIDRATGRGQILIPAFIPRTMISAPDGSTHYRLLTAIVAANFDEETSLNTIVVSPAQILSNVEVPESIITVDLPPGLADESVFLVFGIDFLQIVNGREYPLNNVANNALAIVDANFIAAV